MSASDLALSCRCGTLKGKLSDATGTGMHCICYCHDCQAFARHLKAEWVLDDAGGTELYQIAPFRLTLTKGADQLACLQLSPKGARRWYAKCCNTPLANTAGPGLGFAGMLVAAFPDPDARVVMGPVRAVLNVNGAKPGQAVPHAFGKLRVIGGILVRHLHSRLRRGGRTTPFFDGTGAPIVDPYILTLQERLAATPEAEDDAE